MNPRKPRNLGGRPPKYHDKIPDMLLEYFENAPKYVEHMEERITATGIIKEIKIRTAAPMPTFEYFLTRIIGVGTASYDRWLDKFPALRESHNKCKHIQKEFLMHHGLTGGYNATFAKFISTNCTDLVESSHVRHDLSDDAKELVMLKYNLED